MQAKITTPDLTKQRLDKLKELLPELFSCDGNLNIQNLYDLANKYSSAKKEKYEFNWAGKLQCQQLALEPTNSCLMPNIKKSINFDKTQNIIIEGDNLEVLKTLYQPYFEKIKCIYIDPPYNTGNDFIYNDKRDENQHAYWQRSGAMSDGVKLETNPESTGRKHSLWCSFIYPRLMLARNLLSQDGVIFVSIDDNEVHNLRKMMDEVFGEENFVSMFTRKGSGGRQDSKHYAIVHEYILCYSRSIDNFESDKENKSDEKFPYYDDVKKSYYKTQLLRKWGENSKRSDRPNLFYPIPDPEGNDNFPMLNDNEDGCWRWGKETMFSAIKNGKVEFKKKNNSWIAYEKIFKPTEDNPNTKLYTTIIDDIGSSTGASLLKSIFNDKIFNYPKPVDLIIRLLKISNTRTCDTILDFFAGSGTTAHATLKLNAEEKIKYALENYHKIIPNPTTPPLRGSQNGEAVLVGGKNLSTSNKSNILKENHPSLQSKIATLPQGEGDYTERLTLTKEEYLQGLNEVGNRKFILTQLPEYTDEKSEAFKAGYKTISAICIERVKRAGQKIIEEIKAEKELNDVAKNQIINSLDIGFKTYELSDTNIDKAYYEMNSEILENYLKNSQNLNLFDNEKTNLLYEIAIKNGFDLSLNFTKIESIKDNEIYQVNANNRESALICVDQEIKITSIQKIILETSKDNRSWQFFCFDNSLSATIKTNLKSKVRVMVI